MTQRIFDVENKKDMADLWDILPDDCQKISYYRTNPEFCTPYALVDYSNLIKINWHDKTEITRPIKEATEADVGKLCYFWDEQDYATASFGILVDVDYDSIECRYLSKAKGYYKHARRLTKQDIEELC